MSVEVKCDMCGIKLPSVDDTEETIKTGGYIKIHAKSSAVLSRFHPKDFDFCQDCMLKISDYIKTIKNMKKKGR